MPLDPVAPGVQNVWIQGIGCATGAINYLQSDHEINSRHDGPRQITLK